ncbi:hypothetical protein GCM10023176_34430 [Micromonospora coerulea]|uniref:SURF1-like protein n=1 Tax=Micromonospora coerulea TaxID=47856 RepID=A0ABP8SMD9_9ACTN
MVAVILAVVAVVGWRWSHNHPPYGSEALAVRSSLTFVSAEEAKTALGGKIDPPPTYGRDQLVLGQVSWQAPPKPLDGGWFAIFLIDKRTNAKPGTISAASLRQEAIDVGNHRADNKIAERYPWLEGAGNRRVGDIFVTSSERVAVFDEDASPLTFVARFPDVEEPDQEPKIATAPVAISDLLLALVYIGPDEQVYWAQRLEG